MSEREVVRAPVVGIQQSQFTFRGRKQAIERSSQGGIVGLRKKLLEVHDVLLVNEPLHDPASEDARLCALGSILPQGRLVPEVYLADASTARRNLDGAIQRQTRRAGWRGFSCGSTEVGR
jgi:hypothetical protein